MVERTQAVVLVSGGMDSLVTAAVASEQYDCSFLHIDYGQRTESKERWCFERLVSHYRPREWRILEMQWLGNLGGSALTDAGMAVPHDASSQERIPITYVPFRNTILLAAAVAWSEVLGADRVLYGAVEVDSSGYPDCRSDYIEAYNVLIERGTSRAGILIEAPLISLGKDEIIRRGLTLDAPFALSWSCYERSDLACGTCDSCLLRLRAFRKAGVRDPIPYVAGVEQGSHHS